MTSKHPLRRSCAFCRARKIKCSNETICEACRKQGVDCIYDFDSPRAKGRNPSFDGTKGSNLLQVRPEHDLPESKRRRSCSANSASSMSPGTAHEDLVPLGDGVESLAASLEQVFQDNFSQVVFRETNRIELKSQSDRVRCTGLLPLVAHDLVGYVGQGYSTLGSCQSDDSNSQLIRTGLSNDATSSMFDISTSHCSSPISTFSHRQRNQLIDVWFSAHPLTFLISKTLLLREMREDTCDEILIAVMLADASFVIGDGPVVTRGHELLQWAKTQLQMRPSCYLSEDKGAAYSGVPTRVYKGVTTAQTLVLLAWNALSSSEFRRAICYIQVASKLVTQIKDCISKDTSPPSSSRINGVDVLDIEKELVTNLWWTTFSLNLWMSIQTGVLPDITLSTFTLDSLPETETSSVSIQLDLVSENFNTLQKQKRNIQEMRPLAHVVNTVAYLLSQSDQAASQHGVSACREAIREVGRADTKCSNSGGLSDDEPQHLINAFHQTMIIQLLFPKNGSFYDQVIIPTETLHQFCSSLEHVVQFLSSPAGQHSTPASPIHEPLSKALCNLLDACSRAFSLVSENLGLGLDPSYFRPEWDSRLCSLASSLYTISKTEHFYQTMSLRNVRKQLKACIRAFGDQDSSNALGLLDPRMNSMRSLSRSPHSNNKSSNTFIVTDDSSTGIPSPFHYVEGDSRISSSMPSSSASSTSVSTQSFTPFEEMDKWHIDGSYPQGTIPAGNLASPAVVHSGLQNGTPIHNMWYSQAAQMLNFQTTSPAAIQSTQWAWPSTSAEDTTYISFQTMEEV
ncbi:transcription factor [Fusarium longipes]|uniref:Transcription factor n=1 Tax=Fusarium longipes TaxID=694270 RepID=A0A395SEQ1_9HYPO|nr:transcription factor [Fusarium longipes]